LGVFVFFYGFCVARKAAILISWRMKIYFLSNLPYLFLNFILQIPNPNPK